MSEDGGVSRRDFLRRASKQAAKEAVEVGTQVVPGGAVIRRILEDTPLLKDENAEAKPAPAPSLTKNPLRWLAAFRNRRNPSPSEPETGE